MWLFVTTFSCVFLLCNATLQEYGLCSQVYLMSQYCSKNDISQTSAVGAQEGRVGKAGARGPRGFPGERGLPGVNNCSDIEEKMTAKIRELEEKCESKFAEYKITMNQTITELEEKFESKFAEYKIMMNQTIADLEKKLPPPIIGCHEVNLKDAKVKSGTGGVFSISPGNSEIDVVCDLTTAGSKWTVFQRRYDGSQDFNQSWESYVDGFGNLNGEFWLGLEKLHLLTEGGVYELRIELTDGNGRVGTATYQDFSISGSSQNYKLNIGQVSLNGISNDRLTYQNSMAFSTRDRDNDKWGNNCAATLNGGWWFNSCNYSNLNGVYGAFGRSSAGPLGIHWRYYDNIRKTEMKFRKK